MRWAVGLSYGMSYRDWERAVWPPVKRATNATLRVFTGIWHLITGTLPNITMNPQKSICFMLNEQPVREAPRRPSVSSGLVDYERVDAHGVLSGSNGYRGQWNNLAMGELDFKHVPSQLIASTKHRPVVGDVCVSLMPIACRSEEYSSIVDLYNTYIAKGSSLIASRCINSYTGTEELSIPAIPIHTFVSEWNTSLERYRHMIRCEGLGNSAIRGNTRLAVVSNVTEVALKNVPILSDHLWFVLHCVVSNPSLVKQVLQLVGSIASSSGSMCHTGQVDRTNVPGTFNEYSGKLYLMARSSPRTGNNETVLGDEAGTALGLIWVAEEEELYDHARNSPSCYYLHVGTQSGNMFRCNGFCEWRYYNRTAFERMTAIGNKAASEFVSDALSGNTGDSARMLQWT